MEDVENRNVLVRTDVKLSRMLALCSEPTVMYGRGKQLFRGIARGTQPQVITYWLILWIIATRDATLHERLVNMLVGCIAGRIVCYVLKLVCKRPRPPLTGGKKGEGANQYSFPSDHVMIYVLAYYVVTSGYKGPEVATAMKAILTIICLTKIMLGRIYILDILGGTVLGMIMYQVLIRFLWISGAKSEPFIQSVQAALHLYR